MSPVAVPVPLLLVADSASACERVASALLSAPAFYRIERITSADFAHKGIPGGIRLALVDHELKAIRQADVVQQLSALHVACVALVDARDIQGLQEVVLSGAAGIVVTPFEDAQLWETVGAALERGASPVAAAPAASAGRRSSQGIIITIHAPKSGCGASVVAANLALTLQARAQRGAVLVEAGEGISSQAVLLNLQSQRTLGDLMARFDREDAELLNEVLARHASGLRVLLASPSRSLRIQPDMLEEILEMLQAMFDYVVVDLHASAAGANAAAVMRKANAALVIIVPEMTSLHTVREFADTMSTTMAEVSLNIVLNRATLPAGVPPDAIRRHLRLQVAAELPDDQELVTASVNRGVPFVISHPRSPMTRAISNLADELTPVRAEERAGMLSGLARKMLPLGRLTGGRK